MNIHPIIILLSQGQVLNPELVTCPSQGTMSQEIEGMFFF